MPRSVPLSVRISDADAAFLADYQAPDAKTPSEKLRALIAEARRRQAGTEDYNGAAETVRGMIQPARDRLRAAQRDAGGQRSDLIARLYERAPELVASLTIGPDREALQGGGSGGDRHAALTAFEADLAAQAFSLIEDMLDLGLTRTSRTYDPFVVRNSLERSLELLELVQISVKSGEGEVK